MVIKKSLTKRDRISHFLARFFESGRQYVLPLISWILLNRLSESFQTLDCRCLDPHHALIKIISPPPTCAPGQSWLISAKDCPDKIYCFNALFYSCIYTHTQHNTFSFTTFWRMCISLVLYLIYAVKDIYKVFCK